MEINIRPIRIEDAVFVNEMRIMDGVRENILALYTERLSRAQNRISSMTEDEHMLVAEVEENGIRKVVGCINLSVSKSPRLRHSAGIGLMVHKDYQGMGVGKALMGKIVDLADNWLMLVRLELGVYTDNIRAIKLYESIGFVIEGTKKYAAIRNGRYVDEYMMGRYKHQSVEE